MLATTPGDDGERSKRDKQSTTIVIVDHAQRLSLYTAGWFTSGVTKGGAEEGNCSPPSTRMQHAR